MTERNMLMKIKFKLPLVPKKSIMLTRSLILKYDSPFEIVEEITYLVYSTEERYIYYVISAF